MMCPYTRVGNIVGPCYLDEAGVDTFEALALAQKPASQPWAPVTDYSFEARKAIEGDQPRLIIKHLVDCEDADILDFGCGPDQHLVNLLWEASAGTQIAIRGFDPQLPGSSAHVVDGKYDLVICREVLEHLTLLQIRRTVINLCALSSRFVYVTTRFSSERDILHVETSDDLDPTHITIPSKDLLRLLFVLEGFKRRADLEAKMDWQQKNRCLVYERAV